MEKAKVVPDNQIFADILSKIPQKTQDFYASIFPEKNEIYKKLFLKYSARETVPVDLLRMAQFMIHFKVWEIKQKNK